MKHRDSVASCETGVVYDIPVACSQVYIGHTGRCFNESAAQHKRNMKNKSTSCLLSILLQESTTASFAWVVAHFWTMNLIV